MALRRGGRPYAKRPTDLFKALLVTSGAMTKQVNRLEKLELVERIPDPGFAGGFLITLSRKGLAVVDEVVTVLANESVIGPAMAKLTEEERQVGTTVVRRLLNEMEAMLESAQPEETGDDEPTERVRARPARGGARGA